MTQRILAAVAILSTFIFAAPVFAQSAPVCDATIQQNLKLGSMGSDVTKLQKLLNTSSDTQVAQAGEGSPGMEGQTYGPATAAAVKKFQEKYSASVLIPAGLTSGNGNFGTYTRTYANSLCGHVDQGMNPLSVTTGTIAISLKVTVQTTSSLRVRQTAGSGGKLIGKESANSSGTVIAGPLRASGMTWWKVSYADGLVGWSAQNFLLAGYSQIDSTPSSSSPNDTTLSPGQGILTDTVGNTWSISPVGVVLKNGNATELTGVNLLIIHNATVYGHTSSWFMWTGSVWTGVAEDPRVSVSVNAPAISSVTPSQGPVGTRVTLRGTGFGLMPSLQFGIMAPIMLSSDGTAVTFTIPPTMGMPTQGAPTATASYDVSVKNGSTESNIVSFNVTNSN